MPVRVGRGLTGNDPLGQTVVRENISTDKSTTPALAADNVSLAYVPAGMAVACRPSIR